MSLRDMSLVDLWQRFWFRAVPVRRLAVFRLLVTAFAIVDIGIVSGYISSYSRVNEEFYQPIVWFRWFGLDFGPSVTTAIHAVLLVALVLAFVGLATRAALAVAAVLYFWWFGLYYSFGAIHHGRLPIIIALAVMAIAPAGRAYSLDSLMARSRRAVPGRPLPERVDERDVLAGWALRVVMVIVVASYVLAAYSKLRASGLAWARGAALEVALISKHTALGLWVGEHMWLVAALATLSLVMESTAWLLFFRGRIRDVYYLALIAFHEGTAVILDISFNGLLLAVLAFYDLEVAADRIGAWVRRAADRVTDRVAVLYDGNCLLCVRTITFLRGLDWLGRLELVNAASSGTQPDAMYAVAGARRYRGFLAYRRMAWAIPALWPTVPFLYLPGVPAIGERIYTRVADARAESGSCGIEACSLSDRPVPVHGAGVAG